jgi:glucose/arabinose dehydrogenase
MKRSYLAGVVVLAALVTVRAQPPQTPPQTPEPKPAFPEQTDAPLPAQRSPALDVRVIAEELQGAWAVAFLPDGRYLVTQNAGQMRIVGSDGRVSAPLAGVPIRVSGWPCCCCR